MKEKLVWALAAAVLGKFIAPTAAQLPGSEVLASPPEYSTMSAKSPPGYECPAASQVLRFANAWCLNGPELDDAWDEFIANQGPIAKTLGLTLLFRNEGHDVAVAPTMKAEQIGWFSSFASFTGPIRSDSSAIFPITNFEAHTDTVFGYFQQMPLANGNVLGLPGYSELVAIENGTPLNLACGERTELQFSAGAGVCLFSVIGTNGTAGHQNLNQLTGVGSSLWLGCTTGNGIEIRAGFTYFEIGQQFLEPRR